MVDHAISALEQIKKQRKGLDDLYDQLDNSSPDSILGLLRTWLADTSEILAKHEHAGAAKQLQNIFGRVPPPPVAPEEKTLDRQLIAARLAWVKEVDSKLEEIAVVLDDVLTALSLKRVALDEGELKGKIRRFQFPWKAIEVALAVVLLLALLIPFFTISDSSISPIDDSTNVTTATSQSEEPFKLLNEEYVKVPSKFKGQFRIKGSGVQNCSSTVSTADAPTTPTTTSDTTTKSPTIVTAPTAHAPRLVAIATKVKATGAQEAPRDNFVDKLKQIPEHIPWKGVSFLVAMGITCAMVVKSMYLPEEEKGVGQILKNTFIKSATTDKTNTLVVALHGWDGHGPAHKKNFEAVIETIKKTIPEADLLVPSYNNVWFSNENPYRVAECLDELIHYQYNKAIKNGHVYSKIILVAHSLGGMIMRKAYLFGNGFTQDRRSSEGKRTTPKAWAKQVERIVLLSGLNNGWSLDDPPKDMGWFYYRRDKFFLGLATFLNQARFIRALERGTPFISNTNIQWVELASSDKVCPVIQLVPGEEDRVSVKDNKESASSTNFIFIDVVNANHQNVVLVNQEGNLQDYFNEALTSPIAILTENYSPVVNNVATETDVTDVIFVMHGIRDFGGWTKEFVKTVESISKKCVVITPRYNYFPIIDFLILPKRQNNVKWFVNEFAMYYAKFPNAKFSFVGHSNGTYIVASALEKYHALKLHRIVVAGSVIRCDYPWDSLVKQGRLHELRNDLADSDWAVAYCARYMESWNDLTKRLFNLQFKHFSDIGTGGYNGFLERAGHETEVAYFKGGHSAAIINPENVRSICNFVLNGEKKYPKLVDNQNKLISTTSRIVIIWGTALLVGIVWGIALIPSFWIKVVAYAVLLLILIFV